MPKYDIGQYSETLTTFPLNNNEEETELKSILNMSYITRAFW